MTTYEKKGYLNKDFQVFRLNDAALAPIPFHYHDFHKIILFLDGTVDYIIEGKNYHLQSRDIIFVRAGEIHRPIFLVPKQSYARIVIYVSPKFLTKWQQRSQVDLGRFFNRENFASSVVHQAPGTNHDLLFHMDKLEKTARSQGFANELYAEILFIEFLILLNRSLADHELLSLDNASYDPKIQTIIAYINNNLTAELSIDELAAKSYLSKFYLMRKFKADTGYSIYQYIRSKRLLLAKDLLKTNLNINNIYQQAGFSDYSTFSRAFKTAFGCSPSTYRQHN